MGDEAIMDSHYQMDWLSKTSEICMYYRSLYAACEYNSEQIIL